ncbi:MAG: spore cortex biosynthesis protein YabQ [Cellulosilyticaceae bacterium]
MNELVNTQTMLFIKCIEIGILMGMIYDLIRIFRKIINHYNWVVQVEDALYWIICSFIGFAILYMHNYADIRFFGLMGMVLGGIMYLCTLSILFMKVATWVIDLLKKVISYILHILSIPIKWLLTLLSIPLKWMRKSLGIANNRQKQEIRKLRRKWYYKKADIRTAIKIKKEK